MAERNPARIDESKGIAIQGEPTGAKAAAEGAGDPNIPSVGERAESHHIAHANSKAGEREDEDGVEAGRQATTADHGRRVA